MSQLTYRPDIDGLRAVAVGVIVLFHAGLGFTGGFVGVDVFFVISGYLITGLIFKGLDQKDFSLRQFWERRIRRIVPAAFVAVLVTLALGYLLLLPRDLIDLGKSAIAQSVLLSNVYFWKTTGYFSAEAEVRPLLHTWSLAVEEQFYLAYPILLIVLHRFARAWRAMVLAILAVASFGLSQWAIASMPTAVFYLLPTRAWELLLGGLVFLAGQFGRWPRLVAELASFLGIAAVLVVSILYGVNTTFPASSALLPCGATALLIWANTHQTTLTGKCLSWRPLVWVGKLSYSWYLWHWPIFAFLRYWLGNELSMPIAVGACVVSLLIAFFSWRYVEQPFRAKRPVRTKHVDITENETHQPSWLSTWWPWLFWPATALVVIGIAVVPVAFDGLKQRWSESTLVYSEGIEFPTEFMSNPETASVDSLPAIGIPTKDDDPVDILLWGDSHSMVVSRLFDDLAREYELSGNVAACNSILPLLDTWRTVDGRKAVHWNETILEFVKKHHVRCVVLVGRWEENIEGQPNGELSSLIVDAATEQSSPADSRRVLHDSLQCTVAALKKFGVEVYVMRQVPLQTNYPERMCVWSAWQEKPLPRGVAMQEHLQKQKHVNAVLSSIENVALLSPDDYCFDADGYSKLADQHGCLYADRHHLSPYGADKLLRPMFEPVFQKLAK